MTKLNAFITSVWLLVGIWFPQVGHCQTYYVSEPVRTTLVLYYTSYSNHGEQDWVNLPGSLNAVTAINPMDQIIQQSGSWSVPDFSSQSIPLAYSTGYTMDGTMTISVGTPSATLSFDTGVQPMSGGAGNWSFNNGSQWLTINIPVAVSYSMTTGGQTYDGTVNYDLSFGGSSAVFGSASTPDYPTSIDLGASPVYRLDSAGGGAVINTTAANGCPLNLYFGGGYIQGVGSPVTAPVPEPNTLMILGCGWFGAVFLRRRHA
jgi:hypothetical protein